MFSVCKHNYEPEEEEKLARLRLLVEEDPELEVGTEDIFLSKFLYYSSWNVKEALEGIRRYYEFKLRHPTWVAAHPVDYFRNHFFETRSKFIMSQPDKEGRVIVVFKSVDAFHKFPNYFQDIIEMDDLVFESLLLLPKVQKNGITVIFDIRGTTRNFLRLLSPSIAKITNEKNEVLPFTRRVVHIIQKGFLLNAASTMIMPFISKEFKENIFTHDGKNYKKLIEMIGYENLPAEYGGPENNVLDVSILYNYLLSNADYLYKIQSYRKKGPLSNKSNKK